ncbi:O-antigen ligase family protein [Halobacillus sp. MO56]
MNLIHTIFFLICLFFFFKTLFKDFRRGVLIGLTFTTFSLTSFPLFVLNMNGLAASFQLLFLFLAFVYFLFKKNKAGFIKYLLNKYNLFLYFFIILLTFYLFFSGTQSYGIYKITFFILKSIGPIIAYTMFAPLKKYDIKVIITTVIIGSILTVMNIYSYADITSSLRVTVSANPITVARTIGLGCILLSVLLLTEKLRLPMKILYLLLIPIFMHTMLLTGSRGPIIAVLISVIGVILLLGGFWQRLKYSTKLISSTVIIFLFMLVTNFNIQEINGYQRVMSNIMAIGENTSDQGRIERMQIALNGILESDYFGVGTGGFADLYSTSARAYPHNIFLEVFVELGIIGLILLLALMTITIFRVKKLSLNVDISIIAKAFGGAWFFSFIIAMVSGDISTNQYFWVTGGLIWLLPCPIEEPVKVKKIKEHSCKEEI